MCLHRQHRFSASPYEYQFNSVKSMKASILGLAERAGTSEAHPGQVYQTFNSKVYGDHIVQPQPATSRNFRVIWYDIAHDAVGSLSGWFANRTSSLLVPTATPLSVSCTRSFNTVRALRCFLEVSKAPVEARSTSKSLALSKRCYVLCGRQCLWTRKGSSNFDLCGIWIPVSLQPSVELEVAHCAEFLMGRSRAEPESAQFRRVWSMDRTICPSRRVVYIAALQQIIFNADRSVLERMIRDQGRTTKVSLSSQDLTSILDKYVLQWMGEDAIDGLCFHPPGEQSSVYFDVPMIRELIALVRGRLELWAIIRGESSSNGSEFAECRVHSAKPPS